MTAASSSKTITSKVLIATAIAGIGLTAATGGALAYGQKKIDHVQAAEAAAADGAAAEQQPGEDRREPAEGLRGAGRVQVLHLPNRDPAAVAARRDRRRTAGLRWVDDGLHHADAGRRRSPISLHLANEPVHVRFVPSDGRHPPSRNPTKDECEFFARHGFAIVALGQTLAHLSTTSR